MEKKRKRLLSAVIAAVLAVCLIFISIAGRQDKEESPTICIMFPGSVSSENALNRVSDVLSTMTEQKIGCRVQLKMISGGSYRDEMKRMLLGGEAADGYLVWEIEDLRYVLEGGYAENLESGLERYPVLAEASEESAWDFSDSEKRYAIPDNKDRSYYIGFIYREKYLENMKIDQDRIYSLDELYEILISVRNRYPELDMVVSHLGEICESLGEDMAGDGIAVLMEEDGYYRDEFENFYASDLFENWCETMYQWRQAGLLEDYMTQNREAAATQLSLGGFGYFARVKDYVISNTEYMLGEDLGVVRLGSDRIDNTLNAIHWCVSSDSEYPEETTAFLNLLFTDKEIYEICRYGEEGTDYTKDEEGNYVRISGSDTYFTTGWVWPERDPDGEAKESEAIRSPAYGFIFDEYSVQEEMDLCRMVCQEYREALLAGEVNPDEAIPEMLEELEQAGVELIVEEKQRQFEEHR